MKKFPQILNFYELEELKRLVKLMQNDIRMNETLLLDSDYKINQDVVIQITIYIKRLKEIKQKTLDIIKDETT